MLKQEQEGHTKLQALHSSTGRRCLPRLLAHEPVVTWLVTRRPGLVLGGDVAELVDRAVDDGPLRLLGAAGAFSSPSDVTSSSPFLLPTSTR